MAPRFQQCLHRAIIDTSLVNRVARKFWKTWNDGFGRELNPNRISLCFLLTPCFSSGAHHAMLIENRLGGFPKLEQTAEAV